MYSQKNVSNFYNVENDKTFINWEAMDKEYLWLQKLRGGYITDYMKNKGECWMQDPYYHAEGSVWIHTKMVLDQLTSNPAWYNLSEEEQFILFNAASLHDVCKPETYSNENGRISNKGHSEMGANEARIILWHQNVPFNIREHICNIINIHQLPFYVMNGKEDRMRYIAIKASLSMSNKLLCMMAKADITGRIILPDANHNAQETLDNIELYEEYTKELGCYDQPYAFFNEHTKRQYFIDYENKLPNVELYDILNDDFTVYIMSGLPASGKSTWVSQQDLPVIEMDSIRIEMNIKQDDNQGVVRQEALKRAKILLAKKQSFIWDGVNLDINRRTPLIDLACAYGAKVKTVYLETDFKTMMERNKSRDFDRVPDRVIQKMLHQWTPPTLDECHDNIVCIGNECEYEKGFKI